MHIRRVVTGQQPDGRSVFVSDELVAPIEVSGLEFHKIWGSDEPARLPTDGRAGLPTMWFPPARGFRFTFFTVPPAAGGPPDAATLAAMLRDMRSKVPGLVEVLEPDHPGMHTTDTVDFDLVVSGEVWLELDDGAEVLLRAGDCVVQNGTRHRWRNRSATPCVLAAALVGGVRSEPR